MFLQDSVYLSLRLETFMSKITLVGLYLVHWKFELAAQAPHKVDKRVGSPYV